MHSKHAMASGRFIFGAKVESMNQSNDNLLPPELREMLDRAQTVSADDRQRLEKAALALDDDPQFRSDYLKGVFVESVLEVIDEAHMTQSDLARLWGKSRQYLSKILSEDQRVNFTLETMVELAHLMGRRLELHVFRKDEAAHVLRCQSAPQSVGSLEDQFDRIGPERANSNSRLISNFGGATSFEGTLDYGSREAGMCA